MITATGTKEPYIHELTDGIHLFSADTPLADGGSGLHQRPTDILISALAACVPALKSKHHGNPPAVQLPV